MAVAERDQARPARHGDRIHDRSELQARRAHEPQPRGIRVARTCAPRMLDEDPPHRDRPDHADAAGEDARRGEILDGSGRVVPTRARRLRCLVACTSADGGGRLLGRPYDGMCDGRETEVPTVEADQLPHPPASGGLDRDGGLVRRLDLGSDGSSSGDVCPGAAEGGYPSAPRTIRTATDTEGASPRSDTLGASWRSARSARTSSTPSSWRSRTRSATSPSRSTTWRSIGSYGNPIGRSPPSRTAGSSAARPRIPSRP
jgi:hypothetical protein